MNKKLVFLKFTSWIRIAEPAFWETLKGAIDMNSLRVRRTEQGGASSPWIISRESKLCALSDEAYQKVSLYLQPIYQLVAGLHTDIVANSIFDVKEISPEEIARRSCTERQTRKLAVEKAAELRELIYAADDLLNIHLKWLHAITWRHISAYWIGVLKMDKKKELPLCSEETTTGNDRAESFQKNKERILSMISEIVESGGYGNEDEKVE